jgi:hypothetical protein
MHTEFSAEIFKGKRPVLKPGGHGILNKQGGKL